MQCTFYKIILLYPPNKYDIRPYATLLCYYYNLNAYGPT